MFLGELNYPVGNIEGIGPAAVRNLSTLGVVSVAQLLRHYPVRYEDRKNPVPLVLSSPDKPAVTVATVIRHETFRWKHGGALKVIVADETDQASMLCFGRNFLAGKLPPGKKIRLTGPFERTKFGELQSGSFVFEDFDEDVESKEFGRILPVYPLSGTLNQAVLRKAVRIALNTYAVGIRSELPQTVIRSRHFPEKGECLRSIHFPDEHSDIEKARRMLIFEELFHLQWTVARRAMELRPSKNAGQPWSDDLILRLTDTLPFHLTPDQDTSLNEIREDLSSNRPMSRLLQGEVGSGKTLVAFMAALGVIGAGRQAVFMAPTELLARQHADNAANLLEPLGVRAAFLTGDVTGSSRNALTDALAAGDVDLAVGTHALFGSDVKFKDLGLAIIDEQHRFGVEQRRALAEKGDNVDVLALSATPIPRTLALTAFGDMDVSSIRTMPAGRLPVETHLARMGNEVKVYEFVRRELEAGRRAYFVYPLIEESEKTSLKDAENMYIHLSKVVFPDYPAALVHSRVDEEEKRRIMTGFRSGEIRLLVATSVVEVGVDVPEATCMVIEHAERFGLSALHQLRGRVGRGADQSYCFLVYAEPLSDDGKRRMMVMKETHDGFALAEEDLRMRGPGDMAGRRQSGFLKLTIADPVHDLNVLLEARREAQQLMKSDP
ncbi:MAG: ATP-dependent DNA helicase RecG, partial [Spirochaetaceae bacterium]|nr:ATP-dependent DNA helicase RecG [Spirochaetaceae bacterium]